MRSHDFSLPNEPKMESNAFPHRMPSSASLINLTSPNLRATQNYRDVRNGPALKTHADLGARTLDTVIQNFEAKGFLSMGRDIAASHHEKWDGSGYPRGIKETQIPLSARILALADVYDALTSVRPYKGAWTHEAALEWIVSRAGVHFDPDVVTVFARRAGLASGIRTRLQDQHVVEPPDVLTRPA